ncbi:MAG: hypothetical protein J5554_02440 [Paludibacteraceae bacterium]|nr:hypothetical protein [Paludibacteraceae bacterium]
MKIVAILLSFMLLFGGCLPQRDIETYNKSVLPNMDETLIALHSKILRSGTLHFLSRNGEVFKKTTFIYHIYIEKRQVSCAKIEERDFIISENDITHISWWTAESYKQSQKVNEDYYNCFAMNFLDMSNDEKIKVLEEIAKLHPYKFEKDEREAKKDKK